MFQIHSKNVTAAVLLENLLNGPKNVFKNGEVEGSRDPESASRKPLSPSEEEETECTAKSTLDSAEKSGRME